LDRSKQLETEKISVLLWRFSIPAIVGMVVNALYMIIDRIFIGKGVNTLALSGVAITFPIMTIVQAFGMLVGIGSGASVSIKLGQKNRDSAEKILGNAVALTIVISLLITILGLTFKHAILSSFGAGIDTVKYADDFLSILLLGVVFQNMSFGINSIIRAEGNPKMAMITMLSGAVINCILAPIFIFYFHWGVKGGALATVIAQIFSTLWVLSYFLGKKSSLKFKLSNFNLDPNIIKQIFSIGMAPFAMQVAASMVGVILNKDLITYGGDIAVGAMGIINPLIMLFLMPIFGLNQGSQPIVGYNFGARKFGRVKEVLKLTIISATVISTFGFMIFQLFPSQVINIFSKSDPKLLDVGINGLRIYTLMLPIIGFQVVSSNFFQAIGRAKVSIFLALSRQVIILIPLLLILPPMFKLNGIWMSAPISDFLASFITGIFLYREIKYLNKYEDLELASH
jgi:putative MATE family efflux protein